MFIGTYRVHLANISNRNDTYQLSRGTHVTLVHGFVLALFCRNQVLTCSNSFAGYFRGKNGGHLGPGAAAQVHLPVSVFNRQRLLGQDSRPKKQAVA
jgi:hypothetical protein